MKKTISMLLAAVCAIGLLILPVDVHAAAAESGAGVVATAVHSLNVRSSPSTGGRIVTALQKGTMVTLVSKSGDWWQVEYGKGLYGYCHTDYISGPTGTPAVVNTQYDSLNVRTGPGTSYSRQGALPKGTGVIVLSSGSGWSKVLYHGTKIGYVSSQYLSDGAVGRSAVSLNVPNYKQTDSRWANVQIGSSGKTIAKIGCVTTGIAMMESYRTGTTIYPDAMSKKLSYSSAGDVYWPSHFVAMSITDGYLETVYDLLKQGKPVLIGARNSSGTQHWVVITGFIGGDLTAGKFTIHDPATSSRTTLQQFLNAYPRLYKYFHY